MYDLNIDGMDAIEILSELFGLKDFCVVFSEKGAEYDRKKKTIFIPDRYENWKQIMGLAHEIMHHKQHIEKRLIDGLDLEEYALYGALIEKDERFLWLQRIEPDEIEANAFCALFINKVYEFFYKHGAITKSTYNKMLKQTEDILAVTEALEGSEGKLLEIKSKEKAEHKRLDAEYGEKIMELLAKRLIVPYEERMQIVKVICK